MSVFAEEESVLTPDEPFTLERPVGTHLYGAACDLALYWLGEGCGRRCLVVGSPPFEAVALHATGWRTLLTDVRRPETVHVDFVAGDAVALPFPDGSFDALSSTCCLCHVGLGGTGTGRLRTATGGRWPSSTAC